jgi:hypothetical protein
MPTRTGHSAKWASRPGKPEKLTVVHRATEDSIIDTIEAAALRTTFVIVDLEGRASMMAGYAMSRADLVIIPAQGSHLDATEAVKAIKPVKSQGGHSSAIFRLRFCLPGRVLQSGPEHLRASKRNSLKTAFPCLVPRLLNARHIAPFLHSAEPWQISIPPKSQIFQQPSCRKMPVPQAERSEAAPVAETE